MSPSTSTHASNNSTDIQVSEGAHNICHDVHTRGLLLVPISEGAVKNNFQQEDSLPNALSSQSKGVLDSQMAQQHEGDSIKLHTSSNLRSEHIVPDQDSSRALPGQSQSMPIFANQHKIGLKRSFGTPKPTSVVKASDNKNVKVIFKKDIFGALTFFSDFGIYALFESSKASASKFLCCRQMELQDNLDRLIDGTLNLLNPVLQVFGAIADNAIYTYKTIKKYKVPKITFIGLCVPKKNEDIPKLFWQYGPLNKRDFWMGRLINTRLACVPMAECNNGECITGRPMRRS